MRFGEKEREREKERKSGGERDCVCRWDDFPKGKCLFKYKYTLTSNKKTTGYFPK